MTVIAFRNNILALDSQCTSGDLIGICDKFEVIQKAGLATVLCYTGEMSAGLELIEWYRQGADIKEYPSTQTGDNWCRLVVMNKDIGVVAYEGKPYPIYEKGPYI